MEANSKIVITSIFQRFCDERIRDAFDWAVREQRTRGLTSDFLKLSFDSDWYLEGERGCHYENGFLLKDECIFSLFGSKETKRVILRLDWPERMITEYHDLTNYDELCEQAPRSVSSMRLNAMNLKKCFEQNESGRYY